MKLRQLFEAAPAKKIVAVMPGGFHPFHPGHKSLYDWAVETFGQDNVYVAATNDTKSRPFPFDVKQKLAAMAGVPANRFMQVKSPFNALAYEGILGDASQTALVFVRSEKDKTSHPLPDQVRKSDGNMGYLISFKGKDDLETADTHGYLAYGPTIDFDFSGMSIKSASELRAAWPEMSEEDKLKAAELMYPGNGQTAAQLLDQALSSAPEPEVAESSIASKINWGGQHDDEDEGKDKKQKKQSLIDKLKAAMGVSEDASEDEEDEFHRKLDKLVHKTFGHSSDEKKTNESDVVIDKARLRDYLRMLIDDAIDKEEDINKLSKVLKMLVGKEIRARGDHKFTITAEDVVEACKSRRRKIKENDDLSYAIALAMQAKNLATGSVTGDEEMDVSVSLSPSAKKKMMQMKAQAEKISGMPFEKLVAMGEKQKAQDLINIRSEFNEETSEELPDGSTKTTKADGSYTHSGGWGKKFYDASGKLIKTQSPTVGGLTTIKYADGRGRYIFAKGGGEVRGPLDGNKPGEADYISYAFGGARFVFDARKGEPKISGSIEIGRLKVALTGKVLDRPAFHKNPMKMMTQVLGGDPMAVLKDPMAVKPMLDKGTAKIYLDGKEVSAEQLAQAVEQGL